MDRGVQYTDATNSLNGRDLTFNVGNNATKVQRFMHSYFTVVSVEAYRIAILSLKSTGANLTLYIRVNLLTLLF